MVMGREIGLDTVFTLELGISALLHDVGKVFIPNEVVKKPGRLSEEEWEQIRRHPAEGARALAGLPDLPALASTIALEHHIYCDGTGYPAMPAGQTPHFFSRLVAIIDTYDALTTDRPYRERWTPQQSIAWMLYEGWRHYDRELMARFASRTGLYAIGSIVRLVNGYIAIVVGGNHHHPTKPVIKLIASADGRRIVPEVIDLSTITEHDLQIESLAQPVAVLLPYADRLAAA
jgi:HD-GYP domain-containing protein (c-di-GMP phosphodiesterase class II)